MPLALDRPPTERELLKLRLFLSTFQDGIGQLTPTLLASKGTFTLPGWRDFERAVALAFGGEAQENKSIFDVIISDPDTPHVQYGLSCKMRNTLREIERVSGE